MSGNTDDLLGMAPEDYADVHDRLVRVSVRHQRRSSRRHRWNARLHDRRFLAACAAAAVAVAGVSAGAVALVRAGDAAPAQPRSDDRLWSLIQQELDVPVSAESQLGATVDDVGHPLALVTLPCGGSFRVSFRSNPEGALEFRSQAEPARWYLATDDELVDELCTEG